MEDSNELGKNLVNCNMKKHIVNKFSKRKKAKRLSKFGLRPGHAKEKQQIGNTEYWTDFEEIQY